MFQSSRSRVPFSSGALSLFSFQASNLLDEDQLHYSRKSDGLQVSYKTQHPGRCLTKSIHKNYPSGWLCYLTRRWYVSSPIECEKSTWRSPIFSEFQAAPAMVSLVPGWYLADFLVSGWEGLSGMHSNITSPSSTQNNFNFYVICEISFWINANSSWSTQEYELLQSLPPQSACSGLAPAPHKGLTGNVGAQFSAQTYWIRICMSTTPRCCVSTLKLMEDKAAQYQT